MKGKIFIGIWIIISLGLPLQTRANDIDSLKEILNTKIPDTLEAQIAGQLAREYLFSDEKRSLRYAYLAYEAALRTGNSKMISQAILDIGNVYSVENAFHTSMEYYKEILEKTKNCKCNEIKIKANMQLGQSYINLQKYDTALIYLNKALKLARNAQQHRLENTILLFTGDVETHLGRYDSAYRHIRQPITWFTQNKDTMGLVVSLLYLADYYDKRGNYQQEEMILHNILLLTQQNSYKGFICRLYNKLATVSLKKKELSKTLTFLNKSDSCLTKYDLPKVRSKNLEIWSDYYAALHDYGKAITYTQKYLDSQDSLQTIQLNKVKELFDIRYDMETKIKSLSLLKKDNRIRELTYRKNRDLKELTGILLIFLAIIFIFLFYLFLKNKISHNKLLKTNRQLEEVHQQLENQKKQLEQENQIRNKLFMILAHDLINPFNALLGFAELLSEEIHNFERRDIKRHSEFIFQAAKQLHFLLENLLHWARIQTHRIQFQPSYFELNKTIRDVTEIYRYMAEKKEINLVLQYADDLIVYADEAMITVVLNNLIHNAIKYTGKLGVVTVEAGHQDDRVYVSVTDTGCGIAEDDLKKLFNLEYHFTRKGTSGEEGTGLGLIIIKEFLSYHSSSLTIESTPGQGSRFSFSLPVTKKNNEHGKKTTHLR